MNLQGGYYGYLMQSLHFEADKAKEVQHSIHKKFHKEIWSRFTAALDEYRLLQPGDKVAVLYQRRQGQYADGAAVPGTAKAQSLSL